MRRFWMLEFLSLLATAKAFHTPISHQQGIRASTSYLSLVEKAADVACFDSTRRRQVIASLLAAGGSTLIPIRQAKAKFDSRDFDALIVPPLDDSEYLSFELENGLRVLLCSDPTSLDAAAAIDVHVGACSDPKEVPGLAHFNEHMLFLGTKQYPAEDSFESFLSANGGSSNAFTDSLDTVYYFDLSVDSDAKFAEALKRFGSFFTDPLFTETATNRELNAIESENQKNLQSDSFRTFQLQKARANADHPFSKFFTGNRYTLVDQTKAMNIDLREQLIQFYRHYYSANQMTLAVVGPQSISKLRQLVTAAFDKVPNYNVPKPEEQWKGVAPFSSSGSSIISPFGTILEVVPVNDIRQVSISWPILYKNDEDHEKSLLEKQSNYVAHLLGHEGPSSLLSSLKQRGWASSVAVATEEELSDFEILSVVVGLTKKGLENVEKVVEAVYSYIGMLRQRDIPNYVFDEVLQLEELQWRFLTHSGPTGYAQSLATSMQRYPPPLYVAGPRRLALEGYDSNPRLTNDPRLGFSGRAQLDDTKKLVGSFLDSLTVENGMVTVMSKTFAGKTDRNEQWYGTPYSLHDIPAATMEAWKNPASLSKLKLDFPVANQFIPTEDGLRVRIPRKKRESAKRSFEERMMPLQAPHVIRDDDKWKVYFREDDRFGKPKGFMILQLMSKSLYSSPKNAALATFFELCTSDKLTEYAYDAQLAGLTYDVQVMARGVRLTFGGYNDKLPSFASYVTKKLSRDVEQLLPKSSEEFETYRDQTLRLLGSFDVKQPYAQSTYFANLALQLPQFQYSNDELRTETQRISLGDLRKYTKQIFSEGKGEALIQGNLAEADALQIVKGLTDVLSFDSVGSNDIPERIKALPLPQGQVPSRLLVAEPNADNENAVAHVMIQNLEPSEKDHVLIELASSLLREPFYNDLRTKQQLGYIVASSVRGIGTSRTLSFLVQSSKYDSDTLVDRIFAFLDSAEEKCLQSVSKGDVAVYAKSLIDRKTEEDKDLASEVTRNWGEVASGRLQFDRPQKEAAALLDITKDDLVAFWRKIYDSNNRRVLVTQVVPQTGPASSKLPSRSMGYEVGTAEKSDNILLGIDDIAQFRRDLESAMTT